MLHPTDLLLIKFEVVKRLVDSIHLDLVRSWADSLPAELQAKDSNRLSRRILRNLQSQGLRGQIRQD